MKNLLAATAAALGLLAPCLAQSTFPPEPVGLTEVVSERWPGASISYKQTTVCETTHGVKAWSGYVSLPQSVLNTVDNVNVTYDVNLFFWYFESRHDSANAPTSIYLGGGPGHTSFDPMSNFPCNINPDSNSTTPNPFSWNNHVNMLYIDQPVGTGFSYSRRLNGTLDVTNPDQPLFTPLEEGEELPETNATVMAVTLDERSLETTQNTTKQAARTLWLFSQVWVQEFPEYKTRDKHISLWGTSYGGFWGTGFFSHFIDQNDLISSNQHPNVNATILPLGLLGIGNGCIDTRAQALSYPHIAYNNTYGIKAYDETTYNAILHNVTAPETGCYDLVDQCRAAAAQGDPTGQGTNETVNAACQAASAVCFGQILESYMIVTNRSQFDLAHSRIDSDVPNYYNGFFNQRWVQEDLGVRVNFTADDYSYQTAMFGLTGDAMIQDMSSLEHVLENNISVALVYGDRDYQCNWLGVENITLSMTFPTSPSFHSSGYAPILTNKTYTGGLVRQHGNFSFSRVFEGGHAVASYQPETIYQIFQRSMFGVDVATGKVRSDEAYSSEGPLSSWGVKNEVGRISPENVCYTYAATDTCTDEQLEALEEGTAVIEDFVVVRPGGARMDVFTGVEV